MSRKIEIEIIGNAKSLESALGKATKRSNVFGKALKTLAVAGIGVAVVGLQQSVKAAMEAEVSQSRLQQAFKNSHLSMKRYSRGLEETEKASRALGFGDNDVRESLGSLLTATDSYKKSLGLLTVAQNISRFKHVDLNTATKMLTGAMTGQQRATKALGLSILPVTKNADAVKTAFKELTKEQQKATAGTYKHELAQAKLQDKLATGQNVISAVTMKTKGMAEAYGKTAAGRIEQFKAEFEHLKAELGKGLLPILSAGTQRLTGFVSSFEKHIPELRAQFGGLAQVVGTAGKSLLKLGSSRGGQTAIAGLATSFISSGLVSEAHAFVTSLKGMPPMLVAAGAAAAIFGAVIYAIATSTSGLTLELQKAKQAVDDLRNAENNSTQAAQNLKVAKHQLTAVELAHKDAVKNTAQALRDFGKDSGEYKRALNQEALALDAVKQGHINLKNAHQGVRKSAVDVTNASHRQASALDELRKKGNELIHQSDTGLRGFQKRAQDARVAAGQFASPLASKAAHEYADAIGALTKKMGGTKAEARAAESKTIALTKALGRLPTLKEIKIGFKIVGLHTVQAAIASVSHSVSVAVNVTAHKARNVKGSAAGGRVTGGVPGQDSVPALLTPGEVVLNRQQQDALGGPGVFQEMFGFAAGGIAGKKHRAPHLPGAIREAEARAAGTKDLGDDISAYNRERSWIDRELGRKDLTRSEREGLKVKRIRVSNHLRSLKSRQAKAAKARGRDYSQLPPHLQYNIDVARLNNDNGALLAALKAGEAWYVRQLARKHLTYAQRSGIINALISIRDEIASLNAEGTAEAPDESADLQAQLDQANARVGAANRSADLANAFVATGVFGGGGAGGGAGGGGGGSGHTFVINTAWPPTPEVIRQMGAGAAQGIGMQGFRPATQYHTGV